MSKFWKLTPVVALATVIALLAAGVLMAYMSEWSYKDQKLNEVTVQAQILGSTVTAALVFNDRDAAQEYVNAVAANPEIRAAAVFQANGDLFAEYRRSPSVKLPDSGKVHGPRFDDDRVDIAAPVLHDGRQIGSVYLQSVVEPVSNRILRYGGIVLLVTMASLVVLVLGAAHAALTRTNAELEDRAGALSVAYAKLQTETQEREKAEEALRQSQKMEAIGQLSGGIAHDFNNLLTIVSGNLQILQRRLRQGRTDVEKYVEFAMDGVNRATNVTQRILAFSRRQSLSPTAVNLNQLVQGMSELIRTSVGELITVETRLAAEGWTRCDVNQMENVLLNLVINARDAMPDGGTLMIETGDVSSDGPLADYGAVPSGDYVQLAVVDTGVGMSDEVRSKALDPFFTTKAEGQGTGLGLSMIYGFVTQSGGHLHIGSEVGKGTAVTVFLPRARSAESDGRSAKTSDAEAARPNGWAPAASADAPTVLIVEDEAYVRMLAVEAVREEGYKMIDESDGKAALAILESDLEVDLMITDVRLPGVNGYQLAKAGMARRPNLKVILLTGFAQESVPEELMLAGAKFLYKPYDVNDLMSCARDLLNEAHA
jgi:signal transduction histidine kinase